MNILLVYAALNFLLFLYLSLRSHHDSGRLWDFLCNAVIVSVCSLALLRHSRVAALGLLAYFLADAIHTLWVFEPPSEWMRFARLSILAVLVSVACKAIWAVFTHHRHCSRQNRDYKPEAWVDYTLSVPFALMLLVLVGDALMLSGMIPSTAVVEGQKLSGRQQAWLVSEAIVEPDEKIALFYSTGLFSIRDEGNILTDRRVISYERWEDTLSVYSSHLSNIETVEMVYEGDFWNNAIISVTTKDHEEFLLLLSTGQYGHRRFVRLLKQKMAAAWLFHEDD